MPISRTVGRGLAEILGTAPARADVERSRPMSPGPTAPRRGQTPHTAHPPGPGRAAHADAERCPRYERVGKLTVVAAASPHKTHISHQSHTWITCRITVVPATVILHVITSGRRYDDKTGSRMRPRRSGIPQPNSRRVLSADYAPPQRGQTSQRPVRGGLYPARRAKARGAPGKLPRAPGRGMNLRAEVLHGTLTIRSRIRDGEAVARALQLVTQ